MRSGVARSVATTLLVLPLLVAAGSHRIWAAEGVGEAVADAGVPVDAASAGFEDASADAGGGQGEDARGDLRATEGPESETTAQAEEPRPQPVPAVTKSDVLQERQPTVAAQPPSVSAEVEPNAPPVPPRLPICGLGADVGLPDGGNLSLVVRPLPWVRFQVAMGSNGIGRGVRVGAGLVPWREGPGLVAEYGHYWDGNANGLVAKLAGDGFQSSPVLERVGYDYFNLHLGLNFGYQRVTFFIQGGPSMVRGRLSRAYPTGPGSVQIAVLDRPNFKSTGVAGKLGLLVYVW